MKNILTRLADIFKEDISPKKSIESENEEIISRYNKTKEADPRYNKPNYVLAEKVFREFNDFNLKNIDHRDYVPKSLLPYPKNYIKCAYYFFLDYAEENNNKKAFELIQAIGFDLFSNYPEYNEYKKGQEKRERWDLIYETEKKESPRESFKKAFGVSEISEEDYYNSANSIDSTDEKLIHDFGFLPDIEEDVDVGKIMNNSK